MTRSSTFASTLIPVLTLVLGILIGWKLGPEPASDAAPAGRVKLTAASGDLFAVDSDSGDPATIWSLPGEAGDAEVDDFSWTVVADEPVQYFPDAVTGRAPSAADGVSVLPVAEPAVSAGATSPDAAAVPADAFDEDVWKSELSDLPEEQARELIEIRKRLGKVAAQTLGVAGEAFPVLPESPVPVSKAPSAVPRSQSTSAAEARTPGLLELPDETQMRPAIALAAASEQDAERAQLASRIEPHGESASPTDSVNVETTAPGAANDAGQQQSDSGDAATARSVAGFRAAVEAVFQLNIRNQKTPGYRRSEVVIVGVSESTPRAAKAADEAADDDGRVTWLTRIDARSGEQQLTGNGYDLAIKTDGWFQIEHEGQRYVTRAGLLCRTDDGRLGLRTPLGRLPLVPDVPVNDAASGRLLIGEDGVVTIASAARDGSEQQREAGRIVLVCFPDESALERLPCGLLTQTPDSGSPFEWTEGELRQGFLESSNVDTQAESAAAAELLLVADQLEVRR